VTCRPACALYFSSAPDAGPDLTRTERLWPPDLPEGRSRRLQGVPEVVEGKVVALWKGNFYRVAWDIGLSYQGKTTIVSVNVIRKKAEPERADGLEVTEVAGG